MKLRALSFDFDGCLSNAKYNMRISPHFKNVVPANQAFLDGLKEENKNYDKTFQYLGSNRQSKASDDANTQVFPQGEKTSSFPAILKVAHYLGAEFQGLLLADIYGLDGNSLSPGTSFDLATGPSKQFAEHADWVFDESKATILYAQIHHLSKEHPNDEIFFDFYDDRKDIIEWLTFFYEKNRELLPEKVTLRLNHYNGDKPTLVTQITGTGFIDTNFYKTVRDMGRIAWKRRPKEEPRIYSALTISASDLKARIPLAVKAENSTTAMQVEESVAANSSEEKNTEVQKSLTGSVTDLGEWKDAVLLNNPPVNELNREVYPGYQFGDITRAVIRGASSMVAAAAKSERVSSIVDYSKNLFWRSAKPVEVEKGSALQNKAEM